MFSGDVVHQESSTPANTTHNPVINPQQKSLQEKAKKLMAKAKQSKRKSNFKHVVEKKFKEYDQTLEALKSINVHEAIEEAIQAKINLVTTPSPTTADDLLEMDLKLKLLNKMCKKKSFESHDTHHKLYDLLYEFVCLDQESLDAQDTGPSFKKRPHDHHDPPNDREGEKRKKKERMLVNLLLDLQRKTKLPWIRFKNTFLVNNPKTKKKNVFRNFPMQDGLLRSRVVVDKMIKELIKKDELTVTDLEGVGL
ncbi:hypothetical protein Tco_0387381, partial [Tanacetum coccineum]